MQIEILAYIVTFIISSGLAVIGISVSYQMYQTHKKPVFQILLYQQIFLFSFFIYGIWGNLIIREIISDFNLSDELNTKLAIIIPFLGIPFLIISWFMLLKFSFNLNGIKISKGFIYSYFPIIIIIPLSLALFIQNGLIKLPGKPDLFIIQILLILNLFVHLIFFIPILKPGKTNMLKETGIQKKYFFFYFSGVLVYSVFLNFFQIFEYISMCISILFLFGISILIPVFFQWKVQIQPQKPENGNIDFKDFCKIYEISKRETEIIIEICTGKTNKAISEKLFITLQTVKDHTHRIYTKTGVKSRVQLANLVREKTGDLTS